MNQQQQQQNTVITIPGTNNTIQIPANFGGKFFAQLHQLEILCFLHSVHGFTFLNASLSHYISL